MYYQNLKELIDEVAQTKRKKIDGVALKNIFIEKYGGGSIINMNKALKLLRRNKMVRFEKVGVRIFYWKK